MTARTSGYMGKDKYMTKGQYQDLRRRVRWHTVINSKEALAKRSVLGGLEFIMGGLVKQKTTSVKCVTDRINIYKRVSLSTVEQNPSLYKVVSNSLSVRLYLQDFSGESMVLFIDQPQEIYNKMAGVNENDVLFIRGELIPLNAEMGYFILGSDVIYEKDFPAYEHANKEEMLAIKNEISGVAVVESPSFILCNSRCPMDIVRLFLAKSPELTAYDRFWLEQVIDDMHQRHA